MIKMILFGIIVGTVGLAVRNINLPSSAIASARGFLAALLMTLIMLIRGKRFDKSAIKANFRLLILGGALIGFNWLALFEAYKYTTVAVATLLYYFAPVIVIFVSPLFFKERITLHKIICVIIVMAGMVMISGILSEGAADFSLAGTLLGLLAALLYAAIVIVNKKISDIPVYDKTIIEMFVAGIVMAVYTFITEDVASFAPDTSSIIWLLVAGIVHTGLVYMLYFGSIDDLTSQQVGIFSYVDPVVAVLCSMFILHEGFSWISLIGAVLIIQGAVLSEVHFQKSPKK